MPMRVVLNTLSTLKAKTGVGHYAAQLARHLPEFVDLTTFPDTRSPTAQGRARPKPGGRRVPAWAKSAARLAAGAWFYAAYSRRRFDLYHEPNFLPLPSRLPTVVTVHDLSVVRHPEWHPADRVRRHEREFLPALSRAARVITVSESVRRELIEFTGIAGERVVAVPNGVGPEFLAAQPDRSDASRLGLPERYIVYVGTIEPRKNLLTLLRAWCDLPRAVRESCRLVLAGGWGWRADEVADYLTKVAIPRGVIHLGYVADDDRPRLYANATALAFPSHYEGFGLPPLEMLAAGGAVIASDIAAHREVLGRHAAFVPAESIDGWRAALLTAATDPDWSARIRAGGRAHASQFTWRRTAAETAVAYANPSARRIAA